MYNFVLQIITFSSLGLIIYLLARALPRVGDIKPAAGPNVLDKIIAKIPLAKIDFVISNFFEKFLRKAKVVVMKVDNLINTHIGKIKKTNGSNGTAPQNLPDALKNDKKE